MLSRQFRDFLIDDAGAEVVEFAIILCSFTMITYAAIAYLGSQASTGVNQDSNGLTNGALNGP